VGVLARADLGEAGDTLRELIRWLTDRRIAVCLEERTARLVMDLATACTVAAAKDVAADADALVVLGGDGTLLAASHVVGKPIPVLGVNFGSLGFLTEITLPELYPTLEGVLAGKYRHEERRMLHAVVHREGRPENSGDVLNDVVISKSSFSRIIELEVSVDGAFVSSFRADGLIVSSPTGSTAYNLAAGGPILHPALPAIVLTPICPHMLSNRPLVLGDGVSVEVRLRDARDGDVQITLDGQQGFPLAPRDTVTVTRSSQTIRLVKAPERDYFEVLRTKLKWGEPTARR
jgi:NAD+ kinase